MQTSRPSSLLRISLGMLALGHLGATLACLKSRELGWHYLWLMQFIPALLKLALGGALLSLLAPLPRSIKVWLGLCLGILLTIQISDPLASPLQVLAIGGRPGLSLSQVLSRLSVLFLGLGCYVRFLDALCLEWETPELRRLLRWSTLLQMLSPLLGVLALPPMYVSLPQPLLRLGSALGSAGLLVVTGYLARQAGQEPIEAMISTRRVVRS